VHLVIANGRAAKQSILLETAVRVVGSSDLAIHNAARHLRHISLTDIATPFQDCPGCLDYFPEAMSANPPEFGGMPPQTLSGAP